MNTNYTNGDVICHYLKTINVTHVFGIPGGAMEPLLDALARSERQGGPSFVLARHECGAAFMADGYARETNTLGVCCSTSGPGATNLITGVANAFAENVPMLVITTQPKIDTYGRSPFQDSSETGIDVVGMFSKCTSYSTLVTHSDQLIPKLMQGISTAITNSKPVHISIPSNILKEKNVITNQTFPIISEPAINKLSLNILLQKTKNKKISVVLGKSCEGNMKTICSTAMVNNWDIVSTPSTKGLISDYHPRYKGVLGLAGHESALASVRESDGVIVLDAEFDEMSTCGWDQEYLTNQIFYISPDLAKLNKATFVSFSMHCTIKSLMEHIGVNENIDIDVDQTKLPQNISYANVDKCFDTSSGSIKHQALFYHLSTNTPTKYKVCLDAGNSWLFGIHYWIDNIKKDPNYKTFNTSMSFGSMGWAIGSAIGMAFADTSRPTICVTGDGSFLMNGTEASTAKQNNLNVVFVILNDSHLGMVKHGQRLGNAEQTGYELTEHDFSLIGEGLGIKSFKINCLSQLHMLNWDEIYQDNGPVILDVRVDPEEVPPLGNRIKVLAASS